MPGSWVGCRNRGGRSDSRLYAIESVDSEGKVTDERKD